MLTADDEYSHNNRENLLPSIQVQSSKKPKTFCCRYIAFMESSLNFEYFEKKKTWLLKCMKGPVTENPSAVNMLIGY